MKTRSKEEPQPAIEAGPVDEVKPVEVPQNVVENQLPQMEPKPEVHTKKPKKHKHKKHKKKRDLTSPTSSKLSVPLLEPLQSHLKLKIKFGGETFATKSVSRSSVTDAVLTEQEALNNEAGGFDEEDPFADEDALSLSDTEMVEDDDEEAWLEALEAGELNEHGELKKEKDVNLLTARQKALLQVKADNQQALWELPHPSKPSELITEEMMKKRALRAQRRRDQAQKKDLENKKQTIERLLKKQEVKTKSHKSGKPKKKTEGAPQIHYVNSLTSISLSYPEGMDFPLVQSKSIAPPKPVRCGVEGCKNLKKYSCSKTGVPLCSLECYKKNLTQAVIAR